MRSSSKTPCSERVDVRSHHRLDLAALAALLGLAVSGTGLAAQDRTTVIEVAGTGEVSLAADYAIVVVGVRAVEASVARAAEVMSDRIDGVVDTLVAMGFARDSLSTGGFRIATERDFANGNQVIGYSASVNLRVRTQELDRLAEIVAAAIAAGATDIGQLQFGSTQAGDARPEALRLALRAARADAEVIAAAEGGTLGRLLEITTVGGSQARQYGGIEMPPPPSISDVVLAPGAVTVRASVVVRWELAGNQP